MKRNRICNLLGIEYPIIQGGMLWLATAELAAAVSNAGGLGIVSPLAGMNKDGEPAINFENHIARAKALTPKPFGVNIPLELKYADALIEIAITNKVNIVITAAGNPSRFSSLLKKEGMTVLHVVSSVHQALKAESFGVDAVIAQGIEAAAFNGKDELPLFALIPQVADAVRVPVVAAGGIADARGLVAALALGADGVQLGTRFVAVTENIAHINYKQAIVDARDTDTAVTCRRIAPIRTLKTDFTKAVIELEKSGASEEDIFDFIGYRTNWDSQIQGRMNSGEAYCGAAAGLIKEILPVNEVIRQLVGGFVTTLKSLDYRSTDVASL